MESIYPGQTRCPVTSVSTPSLTPQVNCGGDGPADAIILVLRKRIVPPEKERRNRRSSGFRGTPAAQGNRMSFKKKSRIFAISPVYEEKLGGTYG
jgi:hypothetical protein